MLQKVPSDETTVTYNAIRSIVKKTTMMHVQPHVLLSH